MTYIRCRVQSAHMRSVLVPERVQSAHMRPVLVPERRPSELFGSFKFAEESKRNAMEASRRHFAVHVSK